MSAAMLHQPGSADALAVGRIAVFGAWLAATAWTPSALYAQLPAEMFTPYGALRLLPDAVLALASDAAFLTALKAALLAGCALVVLGVRPHAPVAGATALLLLVHDGVLKGFNGYINHAQFGLLYAALLLAIFPAADALSVMRRRPPPAPAAPGAPPAVYGAGMIAVALALCLTYTFIGTNRIVRSGAEIFTGDAILAYLAVDSLRPSATGFTFGVLPLSVPALAFAVKVGYAVTTLFEILSPLVLVSTWLRRAWLLAILPFHAVTLLAMNIFFWENVVLILVFLTPLPYALARAARERAARARAAQAARGPSVSGAEDGPA